MRLILNPKPLTLNPCPNPNNKPQPYLVYMHAYLLKYVLNPPGELHQGCVDQGGLHFEETPSDQGASNIGCPPSFHHQKRPPKCHKPSR